VILAALALAAATPVAARVDAVAEQAKLAGVVLVAKGDRVLVEKGYGTVRPDGGPQHDPKERWRLASITKQVTAVQAVRSLAKRGTTLDAPLADGLSARQLLTHHTGLADPDDTLASGDGFPAFYRASLPDLRYCRSKPATPGAEFRYNNCDYLVLAEALPLPDRWPAGLTMTPAGGPTVPGFVGDKPEPAFTLATFGAAGGLTGTARAVFRFDRDLMTGKLINPAGLAELWKPEGNGSYQALGQWVFPGKLAGCAAPKRIVQRDGEIGGVQTRNFILPDDDLVVIVFTNRSSDDFKLGEVWEGKGFVYDLLSAAACS
jgi:D-alanyl-D-alanine carboxypeptidase